MKIFIVDGRFISDQVKGVTYLSEQLSTSNYLTPQTVGVKYLSEQLSTSNYLTPQTVFPDSVGIEDIHCDLRFACWVIFNAFAASAELFFKKSKPSNYPLVVSGRSRGGSGG